MTAGYDLVKTKKQERTGVLKAQAMSVWVLGEEGWGETGREQASGKKRGPVQLRGLRG